VYRAIATAFNFPGILRPEMPVNGQIVHGVRGSKKALCNAHVAFYGLLPYCRRGDGRLYVRKFFPGRTTIAFGYDFWKGKATLKHVGG